MIKEWYQLLLKLYEFNVNCSYLSYLIIIWVAIAFIWFLIIYLSILFYLFIFILLLRIENKMNLR